MRALQDLIELMYTDIRFGAGGGAYGEPALADYSSGGGSYQTTSFPLIFYGDDLDICRPGRGYNTGQTFLVDNTIHFP